MKLGQVLQMVARTDPGLVRSHNEDAVFADPELGVAILADGMGGYSAGEVASGMATMLLSSSFARLVPTLVPEALNAGGGPVQLLNDEICSANAAIFNASQSETSYAGMGTTLAMAWFLDNRVYVAHVGDSRVYRLRGDRLAQLTRDHSLLQEQLDNGMISEEEARYSATRNLVTRALGVEPEVEVEIHVHDALSGDLLLLCSDGLNDMLDDDEIATTLRVMGGHLAQAADRLVEQANLLGGRDNVSVVLARVDGEFSVAGGWWERLLGKLK